MNAPARCICREPDTVADAPHPETCRACGGTIPEPETCEACGAAVPEPRHGFSIGGGWAFLCEPCAARVCACGEVVLPAGAAAWGSATDTHTRDRCTDPAEGLDVTRTGDGCRCDGCTFNAALDARA